MPIINVKLNHFGTFRRFAVEAADDELALASLKQKVHALDAECRLAWIDEDGDQIVFDTVDEFRLALSARKDETLRLIAVKKPVTTPKYVHRNITCDGCEREVVGRRFKCLVCPDFDLCETCEQAGKHGEHAMSRIVDDKTQLAPWIHPFGYGHGFGHCRRQAGFQPFAPAAPPTSNASTPGGSTPAPPTGGKGPLHDELLFKHYEARQAKLLKKELKESRRERKRVEREMREREMARLREGLRASMTTGVDFLREVGAQVQQALSTFGIDVDVSVDNNGKTEKVETGTEAKEEAPKAAAPAAPAPTVEETKPEEENLAETIPLIDIKKDEEKEQPKAPLVPSAPPQPEVAVTTSSSEDDDDWLAVHKPAYPSLHPVFTQPLPTPSAQAPAPPHPHQAVIDTIASMGFNDRNEVTRVVEMTNGNVEEAVNMLISKDSWF